MYTSYFTLCGSVVRGTGCNLYLLLLHLKDCLPNIKFSSGLDDVASSTCVSLLKRVARGGRTVICSLHTPSARLFAVFDHVYIVAEGKCGYQGTAAGVVPFLKELQLPCPKTYNPADFGKSISF